MKIPQLKRNLEVKKYHDFELKDEFSWVHQKNCDSTFFPMYVVFMHNKIIIVQVIA